MLFVSTIGEADGKPCKLIKNGCDSYIKLFINDKEIWKSSTIKDQTIYDANITITSSKIPKHSMVKIEVWNANSRVFGSDALIQSTDGEIDSFLDQPLRNGKRFENGINSIETILFWQDEMV